MRFHARSVGGAGETDSLASPEGMQEYCRMLQGMEASSLLREGRMLSAGFIPAGMLVLSDRQPSHRLAGDVIWAGSQVDSFLPPSTSSGNPGRFTVVSVTLVSQEHVAAFLTQYSAVKHHMKTTGGLIEQRLFMQKKAPHTEFCNITVWETPAVFIQALSARRFNDSMRVSYDVSGATQVYFFNLL